MYIKKAVVFLFLFFVIVVLSACSPYVYKEEVGKFQSGVEEAVKMLDSQKEYLVKIQTDTLKNDLKKEGFPELVVPDGCGEAIIKMKNIARKKPVDINAYTEARNSALKDCQVETEGGKSVEIKERDQLIAQTQVATSLKNYANALAGIVDANDSEALAQSASNACSSTQGLFSAASTIKPDEDLSDEEKAEKTEKLKKEKEAISAVCGLVTTIGTTFLDRKRLKVLKEVVNKSDEKVSLLAVFLADTTRRIDNIIFEENRDNVQDSAKESLDKQGEEYFSVMESTLKHKETLEGLLKSASGEVFLSMAKAHHKLMEAVNDPKTQLDAAIKSIENFLTAAENAKNAIDALSEEKEESGK